VLFAATGNGEEETVREMRRKNDEKMVCSGRKDVKGGDGGGGGGLNLLPFLECPSVAFTFGFQGTFASIFP